MLLMQMWAQAGSVDRDTGKLGMLNPTCPMVAPRKWRSGNWNTSPVCRPPNKGDPQFVTAQNSGDIQTTVTC